MLPIWTSNEAIHELADGRRVDGQADVDASARHASAERQRCLSRQRAASRVDGNDIPECRKQVKGEWKPRNFGPVNAIWLEEERKRREESAGAEL